MLEDDPGEAPHRLVVVNQQDADSLFIHDECRPSLPLGMAPERSPAQSIVARPVRRALKISIEPPAAPFPVPPPTTRVVKDRLA
jgi:hypothetical protein